jgi:hypothetical protein
MNLALSLKNAEIQPSEIPKLIWRYYVRYLVDYQHKSWVGRIAYVFRILAAMAAIPFLILMLLVLKFYVYAFALMSDCSLLLGHRYLRRREDVGHRGRVAAPCNNHRATCD